MKAQELMSPFFVEVSPSASVRMAADLMRHESVGAVCVCDRQSRPLGILTDRDIAVRVCATRLPVDATQVQEVMTRHPITCRLDEEAEQVNDVMRKHGVGRMLVVDDAGKMLGMITLAEIWHHESPLTAAPISRSLTERQLRAPGSGGHYSTHGSTRPSPADSGRRTG